MPIKFPANSFKANDGGPREVSHFFSLAIRTRRVSAAPCRLRFRSNPQAQISRGMPKPARGPRRNDVRFRFCAFSKEPIP